MDRIVRRLRRGPVVVALLVLVAVNGTLFFPAMSWVVPADPAVSGTPTVTDLQLSWTSDQFRHNLAEWSGAACVDARHCTWPGAADGRPDPPPVPDGPAGFRRMTLLLDTTFPILYGLFAIAATSRIWGLPGTRRRRTAVVVAASTAAALCDLAENSLHLWLLRGVDTWEEAAAAAFPGGQVAAASVLASIKYGLLLVLIGAAGVRAATWLWSRRPRGATAA